MSSVLTATVLALMMSDRALSNPGKGEDVVQVDKGVGSITVMVGFLFHYTIPDDAFSGDVAEYKVGAECGEPLPAWLDYDPSTKTFTGFTKAALVDTTTTVCVRAVGRKFGGGIPSSVAEDVLSITVDVGLTPTFACPASDSVVLATVYVDLTLSGLSNEKIFKVLNSLGEALHIPPENIRFTRMKGRYSPERFPVLFSGKGDSKGQQHQGARVQFQVGCSSDTITEDNPFVKFLQGKAPTGELARIIGYPVMDWTVHKGFPRGNRN